MITEKSNGSILISIVEDGYYEPRLRLSVEQKKIPVQRGQWITNGMLEFPSNQEGEYHMYIGDIPVRVVLNKDRIGINPLSSHRWNNKQSWWYQNLNHQLLVKKGEFYFNGEDLFYSTKSGIESVKKERNQKFQDLSLIVLDKYGKETFNIVKSKKGCILKVLKSLSENEVVDVNAFNKALKMTYNNRVIKNIITFINDGSINPDTAQRTAQKAWAWNYIYNSIPELSKLRLSGNLGNVCEALEIYSKVFGHAK